VCAPAYQPRSAADQLLYRVVRDHLETFLADVHARGAEVPRFCERELRKFLDCGVAERGFLRIQCMACGYDRVLAWSCKGRAFCPSCGGRRMADTAAHLVDRVFPETPVRQWVLSLPRPLRYLLAYDAALLTAVLGVFIRALFGSLRRRTKRMGLRDGRPGAVTFVQRFSSALGLHVHFHTLALDGVYTPDGTFHMLGPPTDAEISRLCATVARRVHRLLVRRGRVPDEASAAADPLAEREPLLAAVSAASIEGRIATGPRAGLPVQRVGDEADIVEDAEAPRRPSLCAVAYGFSLHAAVLVPARDRRRLERLCRYVARPPIATERLSELPDGRIAYELKRKWSDGTSYVLFRPQELLERLVALTPRPQANTIRYHGVLAPRARLRPTVIRDRRTPAPTPPPSASPPDPPPPMRDRYLTWHELMRRTFEVDVLVCPRCSGRMRIIAVLTDPDVIRAFLDSLGIPREDVTPAPARPPPDADDGLDLVLE